MSGQRNGHLMNLMHTSCTASDAHGHHHFAVALSSPSPSSPHHTPNETPTSCKLHLFTRAIPTPNLAERQARGRRKTSTVSPVDARMQEGA